MGNREEHIRPHSRGPLKPLGVVEVVAGYSDKPEHRDAMKAYREASEKIIENYAPVLGAAELTRAKLLVWGEKNISRFKDLFFSNILLCRTTSAEKILEVIKVHNPEWEESFRLLRKL